MAFDPWICLGCGTRTAVYKGKKAVRCGSCGKGSGFMKPFSEASYTLAGMEDCDLQRESAKGVQQGEDLTAILRSPGRDVSARAGAMERDSPLFFGTGENPLLF